MNKLAVLKTMARSGMLVALLAISCSKKDFSSLISEFREPSAEFGTIPFFVWNGTVTKSEIDQYLTDFKEAGCGGVFIHARPGLVTTYLTDEWFDLFRYTLNKGKELGLNIWIYDEYNFPSGFAGGHVPERMPESSGQGQGLQMKKVAVAPPDTAGYFLVLREDNGNYTEIIDRKSEAGKPGTYYLFTKAYYSKGENDYYFHGDWYGGYTYVDLLARGVTQEFIRTTMEGYEKYAGGEFGKSMPGIFTDEPHLNSPGGIRWTPDLFEIFGKQWGYSLKMNLPSLFMETGDWKRVRHNYSQTMLELFIDRWARPYSEYAAGKGLLLTGHYWEHNWPFIRLGPDNMAMYPWFQIPGVDCLFNQFNETSTNAQFGNVRSVKEAASVANQYGQTRVLSETYGGAGWDLTFTDMKRLGDWEYALGINLMNQHMSPITLEGYRKYDHPPYFTYHEPWWKHYGHLNRYFARLSAALSSGKQVNDILIIEPTTSAWMYDSYGTPDPHAREIGNSFQSFVTQLEKSQVEYDLGSENILRESGSVKGGKLIVGLRSYSKVIIPPLTENMNRSTFDLLKKYVEQGGSLYLFSSPERIEGAVDQSFADLIAAGGDNIIQPGDSLNPDCIRRIGGNDLKLVTSGGNLYHHRRILKDGQLIFLANASLSEAVQGTFFAAGKQAIAMDPFTGQLEAYPAENRGKDPLGLKFAIPPAGSLLIFISKQEISGIPEPAEPAGLTEIQGTSEMSAGRLRPNPLMLDYCELKLEDQAAMEMHVLDACDRVFRHYGFERGNPWATFVQFNDRLVARDTFGPNTGFSVTYHFNVQEGVDRSGMRAIVERPDLWQVSVNGREAVPLPGQWWLDRHFGVYDISQLVITGENHMVLQVTPMKLLAEIEPVYLTGNFSVMPAEKGWEICQAPAVLTPGSWGDQGMPFYPWEVAYTKSFSIAQPYDYYEVRLNDWKGTIAEVTVNDQPAGTIAYPPYNLDISKLISKGENRITVTVTGSLKNLLGPHHNNPPSGMAISPFWRGVPLNPPGKDYQILEYGLMQDFRVYGGNRTPGPVSRGTPIPK